MHPTSMADQSLADMLGTQIRQCPRRADVSLWSHVCLPLCCAKCLILRDFRTFSVARVSRTSKFVVIMPERWLQFEVFYGLS